MFEQWGIGETAEELKSDVQRGLSLREAQERRRGGDDCSALCLYLPPEKRGKREV